MLTCLIKFCCSHVPRYRACRLWAAIKIFFQEIKHHLVPLHNQRCAQICISCLISSSKYYIIVRRDSKEYGKILVQICILQEAGLVSRTHQNDMCNFLQSTAAGIKLLRSVLTTFPLNLASYNATFTNVTGYVMKHNY
jgi:hypothetical protein